MLKKEDFEKDMAKASSGSSVTYIKQKDIGESLFGRVLEPHENLNNRWYLPVVKYFVKPIYPGESWIVKTSPEGFGEPCPVQMELDKAIKSGNPELQTLAGRIEKSESFLIPFFHLDVDEEGEVSIVGDRPKVLEATVMINRGIGAKYFSRLYQNGTRHGVLDSERGHNMEFIRTKVKGKVEYHVEVDPNEMAVPVEFLEEEFDIYSIEKDRMESSDALHAWIRGFLYGESDVRREEPKTSIKPSTKTPAPRKMKSSIKPPEKKKEAKGVSHLVTAIEEMDDED